MNINERVHSFWASGTPAQLQIFSTKQLDLPMFMPPIACFILTEQNKHSMTYTTCTVIVWSLIM